MISCAVHPASARNAAPPPCEVCEAGIRAQTGSGDHITHPLAEAINRERLSVFCIDDRDVFPFGGGEDGQQVLMKRDRLVCAQFSVGRRERYRH